MEEEEDYGEVQMEDDTPSVRIVNISGFITEDVGNEAVEDLLFLCNEDKTKDIVMFVNSPGGELPAIFSVIDMMDLIPNDVITVCAGLAGSHAAVIIANGTKGKRFSMPSTRFLLHQPAGMASGGASKVEREANELSIAKAKLQEILAAKTGQSKERIDKDTDRDFYMSAEEAREYGLIDFVGLPPGVF